MHLLELAAFFRRLAAMAKPTSRFLTLTLVCFCVFLTSCFDHSIPQSQTPKGLTITRSILWPKAVIGRIPVCWMPSAYEVSAEDRNYIKHLVTNEWQTKTRAGFTDWTSCTNEHLTSNFAIRIGFSNDLSGTSIGFNIVKEQEGERTLNLNFDTFKLSILHEFGHVLGLQHEFYRKDRPDDHHDRYADSQCAERPGMKRKIETAETTKDDQILIDSYDKHSVMNYCRLVSNKISAGDISAVNQLYQAFDDIDDEGYRVDHERPLSKSERQCLDQALSKLDCAEKNSHEKRRTCVFEKFQKKFAKCMT